MSHLSNCPFCGEQPELVVLGVSAWVQCNNAKCKVSPGTKHFDSGDALEAVDLWNSRKQEIPEIVNNEPKISLRDDFAGRALQGTLSSPQIKGNSDLDSWSVDDFADFAYRLADAMLKAREA